MSDLFDLKGVGCKVFAVLSENESARDDDKLLVIEIWSRESQAKDIAGLFNELLESKISHFESIRRTRQKIQEKHPELRGKKWDARHNIEGAFCHQLTFFDLW